MKGVATGVALALLAVQGVAAQQGATLRVTVIGVHSDRGDVLAAVCRKEDFLTRRCTLTASAPAQFGAVSLTVADVPPGTYAVQVFHDENANRDIDRGFLGRPKEGMGFSNGARMRFGPPDFAEAAVDVPAEGADVVVGLRYFD